MSNGRLFPTLPDEVPQRGNRFTQKLGRFFYRIAGWRVGGNFPPLKKFVVVIAPHSSNIDFPVGAGALFCLDLKISFLVKHTLFWEPFGTYLRWVGGIPVDRRAKHGSVGEAIEAFRTHDQFVLGITPEGTRKHVTEWKTGFYRIAMGAEVPIVPLAFDYGPKVVDIMDPFYPTGDMEKDIEVIKGFFKGVQGKRRGVF